MKTCGEKVKELRKSAGLSQDEFAEKIEVARQTIYKWEQDIALPTAKNLIKISKRFNVPVEYFFEEVEKDEQKDKNEHSVFYEDNKTVKIIGFAILIAAQLFVLIWSSLGLILNVANAKRRSAAFNLDLLTNDFLYYGSIILILCVALIITFCRLIKSLKSKKE